MESIEKTVTAPTPLVFPTGDELYDQLMGSIEPELLTENIPHLDDKYTNESEDNRAKRYEHYTKSYEQYDEAFAAWHTNFHKKVTVYRREALRSAERESKTEEVPVLAQLEQDISSALPSDKA